jgi:cell volume regulation protein A
MHVPIELAVLVAVFVVGAIAAAFADRIGAPALLLFLGLGIFLGVDGPGGIAFDDATLVRDVGTAALALILFEGGALAEVRALKPVRVPAALLATVGVLVTAVVVAGAAYLVLDLTPSDALLVGAVVSSTDAAAVFAATRGIHLRERISALLELESGLNDPVAAVLVIFLVEMRTSDAGVTDAIVLFGKQAVIGVVVGLAAGAAAVFLLRRLPLPSAGLAPVLTTGIALAGYTGSAALGGSGLLSAYLAGLVVGNAHVPHGPVIRGFLQGAAWVAQIGLFVLLGLLVTPSRLFDAGIRPLIVAVALVVVARPLATAVCLAPLRIRAREIGFVAAAGLRGGVPIVFATFPIAAGLAGSERLFDVVFFVVVASVALQGLMLRPLARWLDVTEAPPPYRETSLHADALRAAGAELVEVDAATLGIDGPTLVRDLALPTGAVIAAIRREGQVVLPRGTTPVELGDVLYLLRERDPVR